MSVTDPISDMISMVKNASKARKEAVDVKASNVCEEIVKVLKKKKIISNYKKVDDDKQGMLRIYLRFLDAKTPAITNIKRISRPGLRKYVDKNEIPRVLEGIGFAIISTSKGLLTDKEARAEGVGGEVILYAW